MMLNDARNQFEIRNSFDELSRVLNDSGFAIRNNNYNYYIGMLLCIVKEEVGPFLSFVCFER